MKLTQLDKAMVYWLKAHFASLVFTESNRDLLMSTSNTGYDWCYIIYKSNTLDYVDYHWFEEYYASRDFLNNETISELRKAFVKYINLVADDMKG